MISLAGRLPLAAHAEVCTLVRIVEDVHERTDHSENLAMPKRPKGELVVVPQTFDYAGLEAEVVEQVRAAADRIREKATRGHLGAGVDEAGRPDSISVLRARQTARRNTQWQPPILR